jgi:hypothetical protein
MTWKELDVIILIITTRKMFEKLKNQLLFLDPSDN